MYVIFRMKHGRRHYTLWGAFNSKGAGPLFEIHRNMNDTKHKNILQDHLMHYWRKKFGRTNYINMITTKEYMKACQAMAFENKFHF